MVIKAQNIFITMPVKEKVKILLQSLRIRMDVCMKTWTRWMILQWGIFALYLLPNTPITSYEENFGDITLKSLAEEQQEVMKVGFSEEEVGVSLQMMHSSKAPAPDRFHAGFYQKHWSLKDITSLALGMATRPGCRANPSGLARFCTGLPKLGHPI